MEYLKSFTSFVFSWVLFVWNLPIIDLWLDTKLKYLGINVLPYNILCNRMWSIWFWISIVVSSLSAIPTFWLHKCSSLSFSEGLNSDRLLWNYNCNFVRFQYLIHLSFIPRTWSYVQRFKPKVLWTCISIYKTLTVFIFEPS